MDIHFIKWKILPLKSFFNFLKISGRTAAPSASTPLFYIAILNTNGRKKPVVKKIDDNIIYYLCIKYLMYYEDLFDKIKEYISFWDRPWRPLIKILIICETCNCEKPMNRKFVIKLAASNKIIAIDFNEKAQIDLVDFQTAELLSVSLTFGAPKISQSENSREFVNSVINKFKFLWPECIIVHGCFKQPQSQRIIERT
ncbi:hypothetical protein AGLY_003556 [Aphis glycines]|uniref:Uncharacterized protein n=1 Tax=Aphis glycines TaxID=307491 RepID=A0A6G0TYY1_APHGL|nr:hypothetical protein AGLY_003556 [Aphis glycines]